MTWLIVLLKSMSPTIVAAFQEGLKKLLDELAAKAAETENKWDDLGVEVMRKVFRVE